MGLRLLSLVAFAQASKSCSDTPRSRTPPCVPPCSWKRNRSCVPCARSGSARYHHATLDERCIELTTHLGARQIPIQQRRRTDDHGPYDIDHSTFPERLTNRAITQILRHDPPYAQNSSADPTEFFGLRWKKPRVYRGVLRHAGAPNERSARWCPDSPRPSCWWNGSRSFRADAGGWQPPLKL